MQKMLKQLGVKSEEIQAERVIIEKSDGSKLVVENPSVTAIEMQGVKTLQVAGDFREAAGEELKKGKPEEKEELVARVAGRVGGEPMTEIDDVEMVMRETNASREEAEQALSEAGGNLADAILRLQERGKRK